VPFDVRGLWCSQFGLLHYFAVTEDLTERRISREVMVALTSSVGQALFAALAN
jgi:hypothetical protein